MCSLSFAGEGGWVCDQFLILWWLAHLTWPTPRLIAPFLEDILFPSEQLLFWNFLGVFHFLHAGCAELRSPTALGWEFGSFWRYLFLQKIFWTVGRLKKLCGLRLLCNFCIVNLLSLTLYNVVGLGSSASYSSTEDRCLALLVFVHFPLFHSWNTT